MYILCMSRMYDLKISKTLRKWMVDILKCDLEDQ